MEREFAPIHASAQDPEVPLTRLPDLDPEFVRIPGLVSPLGLP
jgi:hypothetical protein